MAENFVPTIFSDKLAFPNRFLSNYVRPFLKITKKKKKKEGGVVCFLAFGLKGLGWEARDMTVTAGTGDSLEKDVIILIFLNFGVFFSLVWGNGLNPPRHHPGDSCAAPGEGAKSVVWFGRSRWL